MGFAVLRCFREYRVFEMRIVGVGMQTRRLILGGEEGTDGFEEHCLVFLGEMPVKLAASAHGQ